MVPDHAHPARGLSVAHVSLRDFRSYARLDLDLAPGLTLVVGANGAGKTNLLEAIHVGTQGFSLRTRVDARLVRCGFESGRVALAGYRHENVAFASQVTIRLGAGKLIVLNGARLEGANELQQGLPALAFTPDRLAIVKGGPVVRRTYLDRVLGRLFPPRADLPGRYAEALAQRNAALRRIRAALSFRASAEPWTRALAELGSALDLARTEAVSLMAPAFTEQAELLGLSAAALEYERSPLTVEALEARLVQDVERGTTGMGPHLQDVAIRAAERELRSYGSQGEQRLAVLALVLAEAFLLAERGAGAPLLLLDDVLSELDDHCRCALLASLPSGTQTLITATSSRALPRTAPEASVVEVAPGRAWAA